MNNTDRIWEIGQENTNLVARFDNLRRDLARAEEKIEATALSSQELDKRSALLGDKVERLDKDLNELRGRRWEVWKIVIAAVVGASLTVLGFFAKWAIDRQPSPVPTGRPPASSDRK